MITSIDAEKAFDEIQHSVLIKKISELGIHLNMIKIIWTTQN